MLINYIEKNYKKLFSFFQHDFQQFDSGEFIDGGFAYINSNTEVKSGEIKDLIEDIREQFLWTSIFDKNSVRLKEPVQKLLKDLETSHIKRIIPILHNSTNPSLQQIEIFASELLYRYEKERKVKIV